MDYRYVAYSESGQLVKGKLSAQDEAAATEKLGYAGYRPVSLKPYVPLISWDKLSMSMSVVKPGEVILFYRQLAMLLESGTNISSSLELLQQQVDNPLLKKVLGEVIAEVRTGGQMSTALAKHPKVFPPVYCRLLGVGEQSGELEGVLKQVADYIEKETNTAKETKGALTYPIITLVVAVMVVILLVTFVLPSFGTLYASLGVELPPIVIIVLKISNWMRAHVMQVFLGLLIIAASVFAYLKTPGGKLNRDKLMLKVPRLGRVAHLGELARCCRSMALLFKSGLPLTEVMPMIIESCGNMVLAKALVDVEQEMIKGEGLSKPMAKNALFLPMMVQMVRVGEETGSLDITLQAVARSYETEADDKMHSFIALIQPAMTLGMGVVIALIAILLMSAMTSMYGKM